MRSAAPGPDDAGGAQVGAVVGDDPEAEARLDGDGQGQAEAEAGADPLVEGAQGVAGDDRGGDLGGPDQGGPGRARDASGEQVVGKVGVVGGDEGLHPVNFSGVGLGSRGHGVSPSGVDPGRARSDGPLRSV